MAEKLKIIPLGGLDEIGKNIMVKEYMDAARQNMEKLKAER